MPEKEKIMSSKLTKTFCPDLGISRLSVSAISFYQQKLSPHKGWCCAYRALTGEESCSEYAKLRIEHMGFFAAIPSVFERLRACGHAHVALMQQSKAGKGKGSRKNKTYVDGAKTDVAAEACCAGCNLLSWLK
ncbi:MAG: membrane protein insertion efficiency factor YidD [Sulfuricella denitrificans]|nr:membrane protein insertion efficiency factor YidD [Sulfuricella denitrificans]